MARIENLGDLTAAILAGGEGTRLHSVVADRPKVLAEIHGRPFLAYLLDQLAAAGVREVVLCTGYLGGQVETFFGGTYHGLRLVYSLESEPRGTAGALRAALPLLTSDSVLVMNGDSYCDVDLESFWAWHSDRKAEASLVLVEVPEARRYGRVRVSPHANVMGFEEKGCEGGPGLINAGIYFVRRELIRTIPPGGEVSLEREVFPAWTGQRLYGYRTSRRFLDIGTPEDYREAERFFGQPAHL